MVTLLISILPKNRARKIAIERYLAHGAENTEYECLANTGHTASAALTT